MKKSTREQLGYDKQKAIKKARIANTINWYKRQIKECEGYVQMGDLDWLRERAFHAVKHLMREFTAFLSKNHIRMDVSLLAYEY